LIQGKEEGEDGDVFPFVAMAQLNPIDRLSKWLGERLSFVFLVAVIITSFEVTMRYVFNSPTVYVHDSAVALSAVGFIFGGTYALQRREHIRISVIYDLLPRAAQKVCDALTLLVATYFVGALAYAAIGMAIPSVRIMETSGHAWDVPIPAFVKTMLALGASVMLAQALVQLWKALRGRYEGPGR
jgi:TRAP-type mannitol/chloroaromatic compound transport system permease small subunit